ncbi:ArnT family glycosyltransferase [Jatrophihabitans sp.]|uniref:ArnT family glycosyltransferase n=1 Tax=Jatrophihabitans sp. TaxID=1932789 RepID=UPI002B9A4FEF|nr:glycosyltransferase family 39 protein [Jatrophihabitans sp.]
MSLATTLHAFQPQRPRPAGDSLVPRPDLLGVAAVAGLAALAAMVRLWRLSDVGFRGDEAVYAGQAELLAHIGGMDRWFILASRGNSNFLVYQWFVAVVYRVFGVSDTAARVVSATFSVLTVVLVYLIGQLLYGRASGFLAGVILAVSGYAVELGRLALLDSTVTFFVTLTMFCLLKWHLTGRTRWLAAVGITTAIATQTKVTSVLLVPIIVGFLLLTGDWRRLRLPAVVGALLLSVPALTPFVLQVVVDHAELATFLSASTKRASDVAWYFYLNQLWQAEGLLMCAVLGLGVLSAVLRLDAGDLLPSTWLVAFALFLQLYPLKGFNYLLPVLPPLALLAGRSLHDLLARLSRLARNAHLLLGTRPVALGTACLALLICLTQAPAVNAAMTNADSAGLREAAYWLRAHGAQRAGVLALSHGSGQYVLSFYGGIDSYPYGKFRIATVLPGGQLVHTTARRNQVPLDWVDVWPARLIRQGRVSYLVYNTASLDDPPEQNQVAGTVTQQRFRSLIQNFGGRLVHVVYWHHEARVYIYRVSKKAATPALRTTIVGRHVLLTATGLVADSPVTVSYHGAVVAHGRTDADGTSTVSLPIPDPGQPQYHVVVTDAEGTTVSATGLPSSKLVYAVRGDLVQVAGVRFTPYSKIRLTYGLTDIGTTTAQPDGTFRWSFHLPSTTHTRYRIRARDTDGHVAWAVGLRPPSLAFVETANRARVTGTHYLPNAVIRLSYHAHLVATVRSDGAGAFSATFAVPPEALPAFQLTAVDPIGRRASVTGLVYLR